MKRSRLVAIAFQAMSRYKLRSAFMMLGSFLGIAALTLVVSIGQAARVKMLSTIRQIVGDSSVLVLSGGGRLDGSPRSDAARLTIDDLDAVAKEVGQVEAWDPQQSLNMSVRRADTSTNVRVIGESERSERVWGRSVSRGQYFDAGAVAGSTRVALIGQTAARKLFAGDDPLDGEIRIGSVPFKVIGVLEPFGTDLHGMDRDNEIVVPISTLMRRLTNVDSITEARLLVRDPTRSDEAARQIRRVLRARHALAPSQPDNFYIVSALQAQRMVARIERILLLYVPLAAAIVLLIGGVVSATLMLASVSERVAEIGLRRAVGARPEDIRLQFLIETTVTTLCGGIGGILLGYVGARMVAGRFQLGGVFSWQAVLLGIAASTIVGFLAGVVPAKRAAALQPIDALR
jgi:putative ABC transport system permease protein